jgi:hypothetical protein
MRLCGRLWGFGERAIEMSVEGHVLRALRFIFWATLVTTFIIAEMPSSEAPHVFPWDKAEHVLAFYVLGLLGSLAHPKRSLLVIGIWLSVFGALIELVQALPFIHRDADFWDWVADSVALIAAFLPVSVLSVRARLLPDRRY